MAKKKDGIFQKIMNQSTIRKAITLFCFCIAFILFWIVFAINVFAIRALPWNEPYQNMTTSFYYISIPILIVCLLLLPFLTGLFIMMYYIYKLFDTPGISMLELLFDLAPPFRDANDTGLFKFFDKLFKALGLKENKGRESMNATDEFLRNFIQNLVGTSDEKSQVNQDFISSLTNLFKYGKDGASIDEGKMNTITKILSNSTPIIVIPPKDAELSENQEKEAEACIAQKTVSIPNDIGTIAQLKMIYANSIVEQNCRILHSNKADKTQAVNHWDKIDSAVNSVATNVANISDQAQTFDYLTM